MLRGTVNDNRQGKLGRDSELHSYLKSVKPEHGLCGALFLEALEAQEVQQGPPAQVVLVDQEDLDGLKKGRTMFRKPGYKRGFFTLS